MVLDLFVSRLMTCSTINHYLPSCNQCSKSLHTPRSTMYIRRMLAKMLCTFSRFVVQVLRQMEIELYTWDMNSLWPFCQLGMDGCRGGVALWYDGYNGNSHILRYRVFKGSAAVYTFIAKLIMGLPKDALAFKKVVVSAYTCVCGPHAAK